MLSKNFLEKKYLNKNIIIIYMDGEPSYSGRAGRVTLVDDACQLHGTWGGCAVNPEIDKFDIIKEVR